jgi:hypothetical protein
VTRFVWSVSRFASLRGSYALLIKGKRTTKLHETQWKSHKIDHAFGGQPLGGFLLDDASSGKFEKPA